MKFLLVAINSKYIHSNPAVYSLKSYAQRTLGIGNLTEWGIDIEIAEYTINQQLEDILADISMQRPDYIGISCYIWNFKMVKDILMELPKILPETWLFLGGPEVSYHPEKIFEEFKYLKGIMVGEGEETFAELVKVCAKISNDTDSVTGINLTQKNDVFAQINELSQIGGMYLRTGYTKAREALPMDEVPFFYQSTNVRLPENSLSETTLTGASLPKTTLTGASLPETTLTGASLPDVFENRILYYESSRGCPYRCSYCLSSIDRSLRLRSIDSVRSHLNFFLKNQVKQVKFIDRTFNANHDHAMAVWKHLLKNDNGVTNFHFEIAADILRDDEIELISKMRPGLVQLEIGVQSTNERTLQEINRYVDTNHIEAVVQRLLKPHNAHIHLDLIAGLPYEDYESFKNSFNEVFNMHPHQLQLGFLKVLKGTPMEAKIDDYGLKFLTQPPYEVLSSRWISYEEIRILKKVEKVLEDYYNSAQFTRTLPELIKEFNTAFDFFKALADFYQEKGYFVKSPARSKKYEILLEFASRIASNEEFTELIRSKLTLDYYLRENPKSRPDFVREVPNLKLFDYSKRDPITNNAEYKPE